MTSPTDPQFARATIDGLSVLSNAQSQLKRQHQSAERPIDQFELMQLCTLSLLTFHRGLHLVDGVPELVETVDELDLVNSLVTAHDELVAHTSGLASFSALQFVNEFGELCRQVKAYVERD